MHGGYGSKLAAEPSPGAWFGSVALAQGDLTPRLALSDNSAQAGGYTVEVGAIPQASAGRRSSVTARLAL